MSDPTPAPAQESRRHPRRRVIALFTAMAVVMLGGAGAAVAIGSARAEAHRTVKACERAAEAAGDATTVAAAALADTEDVLPTVASTALPHTPGWQSAPYLEPAGTGSPTLTADGTSGIVPASTRLAGTFVAARADLEGLTIPSACHSTADADRILTRAASAEHAADDLRAAAAALLRDFAQFQTAEIARIAAEGAF